MFGDPHIKTLDGEQYTFNGLGEYVMLSIATGKLDFLLQGRTGQAETANGTITNATVFTAFAMREGDAVVQVELEPSEKKSKPFILCIIGLTFGNLNIMD